MDEKTLKTHYAQSSMDVLAFYDRYAGTWDERFGNRQSTVEFHRIRLESFLQIAGLRKTDHIAEFGVGTGPYLDMISPLVEKVICVDGSEQMLNVLREKHSSLPNITVFKIDLEKPLAEKPFSVDLVYCFGLIEHIIDVDTFLMNCKKILKVGGRVVFVAPNGRSPWYGGLRRLWRAGRHCTTDRYYTRKQLDDLMSQHSFVPETAVYWGYFPAGIGDILYRILNLIARLIERTWLQQYAGGLTASYVYNC